MSTGYNGATKALPSYINCYSYGIYNDAYCTMYNGSGCVVYGGNSMDNVVYSSAANAPYNSIIGNGIFYSESALSGAAAHYPVYSNPVPYSQGKY